MIRILTRAGVVAALLLPAVAFAAYNDLLLGSSAIIKLGTHSLTVTGITASSTAVSASSFTVDLSQGSTVTVVSAERLKFIVTGAPSADKVVQACTDSSNTLTLNSSPGTTFTDTVSLDTATCSTGGGGSGGIVSSGGGGGGGGGSYTPIVTPTPTLPPAAVQATNKNPVAVAAHYKALMRALKKGNTGADVKVLQQMLNQDSDTQVSLSGTGSIGKETTLFGPATLAAIKKFQVKWKIAKPGDDGYGNLGPKTRAKLNALYGQ